MRDLAKLLCLVLATGLSVSGTLSGQNIPVPTSVIRVVEGKVNFNAKRGGGFPIIDGKLNDRCWEKASVISGFKGVEGRRRNVDQQTEVYLLYNDQEAWHGKGAIRLYLGFKCMEYHMDKLERIGGYYRDAFYPNREAINQTRAQKEAFFRFGGEEKYPHWEYQHAFSDDHWSEERACFVEEILGRPLMEGDKITGDTVQLHLSRRNGIVNENSRWDGLLIFGEATDPVCRITSFGDLNKGDNAVNFEVVNNSVSEVSLQAEVKIYPLSGVKYTYQLYGLMRMDSLRLAGEPYAFVQQLSVVGREDSVFHAGYAVKEEGEHYITFTLSDPQNRVVYNRSGFLFSVAENGKKLVEMKGRLDDLKQITPNAPKKVRAELKEAYHTLFNIHRDLEKRVSVTPDKGGWDQITEQVNKLDTKIARLRYKMASYRSLSLPANREQADVRGNLQYGLGMANNLTKLRRDRPFAGKFGDSVSISACGNEYEGFQLVLLPFDIDLADISITAGDLKNMEKGTTLSGDNIEIHAVGYVITKRPTYEVTYVGWWPDPLVPPKAPYFNGIRADDLLQPFWISVYVPPGTPSGQYTGEITVKPANVHPLKVQLTLTVRNFDISSTPHIKEFFRMGGMNNFYNTKMTPEMFREWSAFQLKHRIGQPSQSYGKERKSDGTYDYSVADENIRFCLERGMNVFDLGFPSIRNLTPDGLEAAMDYLVSNSNHLKEKGLFEYALVEPLNEVSADVTKPFYTRIKEVVPGIKILQKGGGSDYYEYWPKGEQPPLEGVLDIWCPEYVPPPSWDPAIEQRHQAGEQCWAYHDYIDCVIDKPTVNLREIHWRAWARKLDGLAYWSTTFWPLNVRRGEPLSDKWPHRPWEGMSHPMGNGDGHFIYPGPNETPLSSIRLESLRDAQEDYEYLYTLSMLTDKLKETDKKKYEELITESENILDIDRSLPEPVSPAMLYKQRDLIAQQIEKIKTLLN